jgi:lysophospholipase L1-like esterase
VLSVPPLGENLDTELNRTLAEGSAIIQQVAAAYGVVYLPLNEIMTELLEEHARDTGLIDRRPFRPSVRLSLASAFGHYVCRRSWDEIADRHGFFLLIDQVHLSDRGATVVADLVADWLTSPYGPARRSAVRY